jgi:hypothetical protein
MTAKEAELQVRVKFPRVECIEGGNPKYQIWERYGYFGSKLGSGRTKKEAWINAANNVKQMEAHS